jgi:hypothetical protein
MKPLDDAYIRRIISNSMFLEERHRNRDIIAAGERSQERFSEWQKLLNVTPDKNIFETRLTGDGITMEEALHICGDPLFRRKKSFPHGQEF